MDELKQELAEKAKALGHALLGVVTPETADQYAGIEVGWVNRTTVPVTEVFAGVRSVVVVGYPIWDRSLDLALRRPGGGWTYPGHILPSLAARAVRQALTEDGHRVNSPGYAPISFKKLAVEAGFGAQGKSSLLINRVYGPNLRLGVVLTDAELTPDQPAGEDLCGECRACVEACPVGALEPYRLDPHRCLVGSTLRGKERPADDHQTRLSAHAHVMCRVCQDVCPHGRFREDEPGWAG
ncbi:MAG: 4Fe-4S double cluster binding domain-containing protein [bacterium]|nr:4Fe-4S double cluster binding domain-containing protein [bacterium]